MIEAYKVDVDRTLLDRNLRLAPQERVDRLIRDLRLDAEIRRAMDEARR